LKLLFLRENERVGEGREEKSGEKGKRRRERR
jgi:hypothetical protein